MKTRISLAAAALVLVSCGGTPAGNESNVAADNTAAPADNAAEAPAQPAGGANVAAPAGEGASASLSRDYIVGRWTETGDCADAIEFRADGSLIGPFGESARWELRGNELYMVDNPEPLVVTVVDANTMETVHTGGRTRRPTRC